MGRRSDDETVSCYPERREGASGPALPDGE